jgi:hypothetical protein
MRTGVVLALLISTAAFAEGKVVYAVAWTDAQQQTMATRAIQDQVDAQLRTELARHGAVVNAGEKSRDAIVLMPRLVVDQNGTTISMLKVGADHTVLGSVKAKARGRHGDEKLRELIRKAVEEAVRL